MDWRTVVLWVAVVIAWSITAVIFDRAMEEGGRPVTGVYGIRGGSGG